MSKGFSKGKEEAFWGQCFHALNPTLTFEHFLGFFILRTASCVTSSPACFFLCLILCSVYLFLPSSLLYFFSISSQVSRNTCNQNPRLFNSLILAPLSKPQIWQPLGT